MTFEQIRALFPHYTAVDDDRQRLIYDLVLKTKPLGSSMAEIGVYKGGTSFLIANTDPSRPLYSCDSFEGLPTPNPSIDTHFAGEFNDTSYESVVRLLQNNPQVKVIKGFFPDKELHVEMMSKQYSFIHIDVDLYQGTLDCLEFFYSRLLPGGILVSDDYTMPSCPGVKKAFDEFMRGKPEVLIDSGFKSCYFVKV